MDRFIVQNFSKKKGNKIILKSNMDRFIAREYLFLKIQQKFLKSNMDRFIARFRERNPHRKLAFKIQYG